MIPVRIPEHYGMFAGVRLDFYPFIQDDMCPARRALFDSKPIFAKYEQDGMECFPYYVHWLE